MKRCVLYIGCWLLARSMAMGQEGSLLPLRNLQEPVRAERGAEGWWYGEVRSLRYRPEGRDLVIMNGTRRFNRALYGTNAASRVEAGDLPEFALYMPGMGGNMQLGLVRGDSSKWLIRAKSIKAIYRPGSMLYIIRDPMLGGGRLYVTVLALADAEGMVVKIVAEGIDARVRLVSAFGGATGKKFTRDGDIGADPESSFYCKPEYCRDNKYRIDAHSFQLCYGGTKKLAGVFPEGMSLKLADAGSQGSPLKLMDVVAGDAPMLAGVMPLTSSGTWYFLIRNPGGEVVRYAGLPAVFDRAECVRKLLADRVVVNTPDPYLNTLGGALAVAADGIWEDPSYLHGAIAWRMRLPAWRGPYVADPLGWHDRAQRHFSSYALSQLLSPDTGPIVADTALHLARQLEKMGTFLFSNGYICRNPGGDLRAHHYDMNLVFIDALLDHFCWTGDTAMVRAMWPVLRRHLAWEKRCFDPDGDGLYDAYCCIWASDALEYSGGGVTHSSAYNYRANRVAAELAVLIGEDPGPYRTEADLILHAMNTKLWMPAKGAWAEYIDRDGTGRGGGVLHPAAGLWTYYHTIDSRVPDPFQAWQSLRVIDREIPHIPVRARGLADSSLYTLSTTNWQPYSWSLNNVVMAESLHTALAYWQGGRPDAALPLWKGALVESMYLGASPGNFQQISSYDAMRGELYRDFADPIGMAARSLVEGLYGIRPDALHGRLTIQPGWPLSWKFASLRIPDVRIDYVQKGNIDTYTIANMFSTKMDLRLRVRARTGVVGSVMVNGKAVSWSNVGEAIGGPMLEVDVPAADLYTIRINWLADALPQVTGIGASGVCVEGQVLSLSGGHGWIEGIYDPQAVLEEPAYKEHGLKALVRKGMGDKTFFLQLRKGAWTWWCPVSVTIVAPLEMRVVGGKGGRVDVLLRNRSRLPLSGKLVMNYGSGMALNIGVKDPLHYTMGGLQAGRNHIRFEGDDATAVEVVYTDWGEKDVSGEPATKGDGLVKVGSGPRMAGRKKMNGRYDTIGLRPFFNDAVTQIFQNQYLSPRPAVPTLQLPVQGIGNWCYPLVTALIDDRGLRQAAGEHNEIWLGSGVPMATPGTREDGTTMVTTRDGATTGRGGEDRNIIFTSRWDHYPDSAAIPLSGRAAHAYFLLAGSTNPMQSRITNGELIVRYKDGWADTLALINPVNWWPIEQDYYVDGYAFTTGGPRPLRVSLKTGRISQTKGDWVPIKGFTETGIDGGAATVLDMPLHPEKELDRLILRTLAGDVVIGLMSLTLLRE